VIRRWLEGRLHPRAVAMAYFASIITTCISTGVLLALILLHFVSGSLLAAMGDACGGIFAAGHGFLAASRWNYLLASLIAALFISQLGFLLGGGARLLKVTHRFKQERHRDGGYCPALSAITCEPWARRLFLEEDASIEAQTVGLLRPRIALSSGIVNTLTGEELRAVVAHEEAHRSGRDNFILAIAKSMSLTLFYLPGMRIAFRQMCAGFEKAADRKAARKAGGPLVVAGALARLATTGSAPGKVASPAMVPLAARAGGNGELTSRLAELVHGPVRPRHGWRHSLVFMAALAALLMIFASSALAVTNSDQRDAFICFTEHQETPAGDVCNFDHTDAAQ